MLGSGLACPVLAESARQNMSLLLKPVSDPTFSEIIGCHLDQNLVARKHPDTVLAHSSRRMGDDLVFVLELHPEGGVGEQLRHHSRKFEHFFLRHKAPSHEVRRRMVGAGGKIKDDSASHDSPIQSRAPEQSPVFAPARRPKRPANSGRRVASRDVNSAGGGVGWRVAPPRGHCMASRRPALEPGDSGPVDNIEFRHLDDAVASRGCAFFAGERPGFKKDGRRSARIAHPSKEGVEIKIKGAGLHGRAIQFGTRRKTGPKATLLRLRRQDDGGRSLGPRQRLCRRRVVPAGCFPPIPHNSCCSISLGYKVVPCLGIGRVEKAGLSSWFSVFEVQPDWAQVTPPEFSLEAYCEELSMSPVLRDPPKTISGCVDVGSRRASRSAPLAWPTPFHVASPGISHALISVP